MCQNPENASPLIIKFRAAVCDAIHYELGAMVTAFAAELGCNPEVPRPSADEIDALIRDAVRIIEQV